MKSNICGPICKKLVTKSRRERPLTVERVREVLNYDPDTGELTWRIRVPGRAEPGDMAGHVKKNRRSITIDGREYFAARLAWLHYYGEWPRGHADHKNRNTMDNSIKNLRDATPGQNRANSRRNSNTVTGLKGVSIQRRKNGLRFIAKITVNNKSEFIGRFDTAEEAHAAYIARAQAVKGEFAHDGSL